MATNFESEPDHIAFLLKRHTFCLLYTTVSQELRHIYSIFAIFFAKNSFVSFPVASGKTLSNKRTRSIIVVHEEIVNLSAQLFATFSLVLRHSRLLNPYEPVFTLASLSSPHNRTNEFHSIKTCKSPLPSTTADAPTLLDGYIHYYIMSSPRPL